MIVPPARVTVSMLRMWMRLNGVSRGTTTSLRRSLRHTSTARVSRSVTVPVAMVAKVFIEHGTTAMPMVRNDPDEIAAPKSSGS